MIPWPGHVTANNIQQHYSLHFIISSFYADTVILKSILNMFLSNLKKLPIIFTRTFDIINSLIAKTRERT